jgi:hypothetical protein
MHELEGEGADMPPSLLNNSGNSTGKLGIASLLLLFPATCRMRAELSFRSFRARDEHDLLIRCNPAGHSAKRKSPGQDHCRRATGARYNGESLVYSPATILLGFGTFPIGLKYNPAENPLRHI